MKILFLTIGDETVASSRARVYGYLPYLMGKGVGYKILIFTSKAKVKRILNLKKDNFLQFIFEIFYKMYIIFRLFLLSRRFDIIFVQKVILPKLIWKILKNFNKKIVFDFDDAIYLYRDVTYVLKDASSVIVSNRDLRRFASTYNERVHELLSPVKVGNQFGQRKDNFVTLGWIGSPQTSKYLNLLLPVFKHLKANFKNLNIEFMGALMNENFKNLGIKVSDWSLDREENYLNRIDIGIMPLDDDEWSRAKAGYKLLVYMSKGIPCVASPVGINKEIVEEGITGFFADNEMDWVDRISTLLNNRELANKMGNEGRHRVVEYFSYRALFPKFFKMLESIISS